MTNLNIYDKYRSVPETAKKTIQAGRLKGFTDINPMWRIKSLTEEFGMCGIGWYYDIVDERIEEGGNNEKSAFVKIHLFVKVDGEWSKPIVGTGGASFIANEKRGLYTNDDCFKSALTDAISIACKALGFGADVYYEKDISKYDGDDKKIVLESINDKKVALENYYNKNTDDLHKMLQHFSLGEFSDFSNEQIETIYKGLQERGKL